MKARRPALALFAMTGLSMGIVFGSQGCSSTSPGKATSTRTATVIQNTNTFTNTFTNTSTPTPAGGFIASIGGIVGSAVVSSVYVGAAPSGAITGWTTAPSLPVAAFQGGAFYDQGFVYSIGGSLSSGCTSAVYAAPVTGGTIGAWTSTNPVVPTARRVFGLAVTGGYVYVVGGNCGSTMLSSVYTAQITAPGTLGSWTSTTALPATIGWGACSTDGSYVYIMGGYNGTADGSTVYVGTIGSPGSISGWTTSTMLPYSPEGASGLAANGSIFSIGGYSGAMVSTTYTATASGGTVGSWSTSTPLAAARGYFGHAKIGSNAYVFGGAPASGGYLSTVYYSAISGGSFGSWMNTTAMPNAPAGNYGTGW